MTHDPIVIVGAARTPMGAFQGELSSLTAPQLAPEGATARVAGRRGSPYLRAGRVRED